MKTPRTDAHTPSAIQPLEYTFVEGLEFPRANDMFPVRIGMESYMQLLADGTLAQIHEGPDRCDVCGAAYMSGAIYWHRPSGEAITIGWRCAEKMMFGDLYRKIEGKRRRDRALARAARWADYRKIIGTAGPAVMKALRVDHYITQDIRAKILSRPEWGLTPKQQDLLLKLEQQVEERKAQRYVPIPAVEGRMQIVGTVVSVKQYDGHFGPSLKMVVRIDTEDGAWMCWGTFPASLEDEADLAWGGYQGAPGATVSFEASLKGGGDDEHFGFFKRPSKAKFIGVEPAVMTTIYDPPVEAKELNEDSPWSHGHSPTGSWQTESLQEMADRDLEDRRRRGLDRKVPSPSSIMDTDK